MLTYNTAVTECGLTLYVCVQLSLLSCAVIGSYLFVLMIDWFLIGCGVHQMVLNSVRKSAIPGFSAAYVTVPYQLAGHCFIVILHRVCVDSCRCWMIDSSAAVLLQTTLGDSFTLVSGMHHYECIAPNVDINVQTGWFWAKSTVSIRERLNDSRSCWIVFIHMVRGHPGGLLQFSRGKLLRCCSVKILVSLEY